jgi:hypothetical protein
MSKESILEQALLRVQTLEEAVKQNAKGILASTMKQELNELLKESMEEEDDVAEQIPGLEDENGMPSDEEGNDDDTSINDDEPLKDIDDESSDEESEEDEISSDEDDFEMPDFGNEEGEDEEDVLDMTDASDDEVLKVFKSMKPEDGIVVKKDGNNVELEDGDDEYIIKLEDGEGEEVSDEEVSEEVSEEEDCQECGDNSMEEEVSEGESEEDDTIYEIDLDIDEEISDEESDIDEQESEEEEVDEAARTTSNAHGDKGESDHAGLPSKKKYAAGSEINEEVETLKKQNAEYKKALILFKDKLNEVAVFNANLAYATRLFTEHSTTRQEKLGILKRFDSVSTMTESKSTFKTIQNELSTKTTVTESVVEKITSAPTTSSSQEVLSESKAYESPQFKRMKDLMSKLK